MPVCTPTARRERASAKPPARRELLVSGFARLTGCYVVASTEMQVSARRSYTKGQMDNFEGLVMTYGPDGTIRSQHRYPSLLEIALHGESAIGPNRE